MTALAGTQTDESTCQSRGKPVGIGIADAFGVANQQRVVLVAVPVAVRTADNFSPTARAR